MAENSSSRLSNTTKSMVRQMQNIDSGQELWDKMPQELWDKITVHLPTSLVISAAEVLNFKLNAYDRVWNTVFESGFWLKSCAREHANVVLVGIDLDVLGYGASPSGQPRLALVVFDREGNVQYLGDDLGRSLRGISGKYCGPGQYQLEHLSLAIGSLEVPEILCQDFTGLFHENNAGLQTNYCYWNDPEKRIRTLKTTDIRGIDGPLTKIKDLAPIFLLNIDPPVQQRADYFPACANEPIQSEQFIFRAFGGQSFNSGRPPLVDAVGPYSAGSVSTCFRGFTFLEERYKGLDRQTTDWVCLAELESGYRCDVIETFR